MAAKTSAIAEWSAERSAWWMLACAALLLAAPSLAWADAWSVGVAQVDVVPERSPGGTADAASSLDPCRLDPCRLDPCRLEISVRLPLERFEAALEAYAGGPLPTDRPAPDAQVSRALASRYVRDTLRITEATGRSTELSWVGLETEPGTVWIYLEARLEGGLDGVRIEMRSLFERVPRQLNTVRLRLEGGPSAARTLSRAEPVWSVEWPPPARSSDGLEDDQLGASSGSSP